MNAKSPTKSEISPIRAEIGIKLAHKIIQILIAHPFKGAGRIRNLVTKMFIPIPRGSTVIHTIYGFKMIVDPVIGKGLEKSIYFEGTYEAGTLHVMQNCLRMGDTFIDVGSNIGLMSLLASQHEGTQGIVYSFEPEPETFAILQNNIKLNKIRNIRVFDVALGAAKDAAIIYKYCEINRGSASLIKPNYSTCERAMVEILTLDEFVNANDISNIRMLKIDVEGWELEVLRGANRLLSSLYAPIICIEYGSEDHAITTSQLLEIYEYILTINEYSLYKLANGKSRISKLVRINNDEDLPHYDNIFCFLPVHIKSLPRNMFV